MDFVYFFKVQELCECVSVFMEVYVYFVEVVFECQVVEGDCWQLMVIMEELKVKVKVEGLWNLFLFEFEYGVGLVNYEYVLLVEIMGCLLIGLEFFNCVVLDIGNMEVLVCYGSEEQKCIWLELLLSGEICLVFVMIELGVVLFDVINMEVCVECQGDDWVINGCKWWIFGVCDLCCKILIFMGLINLDVLCYQQYLMILVLVDIFGVKIFCLLLVFGYDDVLYGYVEVLFENVWVFYENVIFGEGCGFEIVQGCFGLGCIYYCMCFIGMVECVFELMCKCVVSCIVFGKLLVCLGGNIDYIVDLWMEINMVCLLILQVVYMMDIVGNKIVQSEIVQIKVVVFNVVLKVIDWVIQMYGGVGVFNDFLLVYWYVMQCILCLVDGLDEVYCVVIGKFELGKYVFREMLCSSC